MVKSNPKAQVFEISRPVPWALACLLSGIVLCLYWQTVNFQFVNLDDPVYVAANEHVRSGLTAPGIGWALTNTAVYWHPLAWLSHMLDIELFGLVAGAHHVTSAFIQALTAILLCLLLFRLTSNKYRSIAAASIWALHPLRVESVAWIAERKDVLSGFFGVLTLLMYTDYARSNSRKRYGFVLGSFALALMSKPTLVVLPFVMLLMDWWPLPHRASWKRRIIEKLPLFAFAGVVAAITIIAQRQVGALSFHGDVSLFFRAENAVISAVAYLGKMFWPVDFTAFYPYPKRIAALNVVLCATLLGFITWAVIWQRIKRPYLMFCWGWFAIMLLPVIGLVQAGRQGMGDRFTYWPMIGIVWALVWLVGDWVAERPQLQRSVGWTTAAVLVLLGSLTWHQVGYWRDSVTLFERALQAGGDNDYMRGNLGTTLIELDHFPEAETHLLAAVRLGPGEPLHHYNLAVVESKLGKLEQARNEAKAAIAIDYRDNRSHALLGLLALRQGMYSTTRAEFIRAVELGYDRNVIAGRLNDIGAGSAQHGEFGAAETLLRTAVELQPELIQAQKNLTILLLNMGKRDEARRQVDRAIAIIGKNTELQVIASHLSEK